MRIKLSIILAALAFVVVGCTPSDTPAPAPAAPPAAVPDYPVRSDFRVEQAMPGYAHQYPVHCFSNSGGVINNTQKYICRVVEGDPVYVNFPDYVVAQASAIAVGGAQTNKYGVMIVMNNGDTYEGCAASGANWSCDYKTNAYTLKTGFSTQGFGNAVLNYWFWAAYPSNANAACAYSLAVAWTNPVTSTILNACGSGANVMPA